jgi:Asp-tRNA(Asn)/Glu-tRNA(Gln) amidotransferase A subunit family amidase
LTQYLFRQIFERRPHRRACMRPAGQNTAPFDCTQYPAMNVPCAKSSGLPIGMMLIGRHREDDVVLRAAHAFEQAKVYA